MNGNHNIQSAEHRLSRLLNTCAQDCSGIYSAPRPTFSYAQRAEQLLRESVAARRYENYLADVAKNHSISVMDREVDRFLCEMPEDALILDIGGCWGWHWRRLALRPGVAVLIVDFVRSNLLHALNVLGPLVGTRVALMHADATALPLPEADADSLGFDGVWTVQVFQHIPDFTLACREANRVLKPGGRFVCYSLHATPVNRLLYRLLGKTFHLEGMVKDGSFFLSRANDRQGRILADIFGGHVTDRYTECLFHPDLKLEFTGQIRNPIGRLDALLSELPWLGRWIARQRSFEATKV
jgi:ubiquinone/menaquinone biosynthesis C-methylase UbiE